MTPPKTTRKTMLDFVWRRRSYRRNARRSAGGAVTNSLRLNARCGIQPRASLLIAPQPHSPPAGRAITTDIFGLASRPSRLSLRATQPRWAGGLDRPLGRARWALLRDGPANH